MSRKVRKILLVDDDTVSNFITEDLIRQMKVTENISVVNDGQEALDYIKQNCLTDQSCPELILLDIKMPVMDGFEFLDEFEKLTIHNQISVVLLTTSSSPKDVEKAKKYRVLDYINKPITEEKLNSLFVNLPK